MMEKLSNLSDFAKYQAGNILNEAADEAAAWMKKSVPVDTGRLKRNILVTKSDNHIVIESEAIDPETGANYAPIIDNYGGRFKRGQYYWESGMRLFRVEARRMLRERLGVIFKVPGRVKEGLSRVINLAS